MKMPSHEITLTQFRTKTNDYRASATLVAVLVVAIAVVRIVAVVTMVVVIVVVGATSIMFMFVNDTPRRCQHH